MSKYFVIGTDTDAGKTFIVSNIIKMLERMKVGSICLKPVASGRNITKKHCDDVESILEAYNYKYSSDDINVYSFDEYVAPHIIANRSGYEISTQKLLFFIKDKYSSHDNILIEGAGGLLTPYSDTYTQLDLIKELAIDVLLIVRIKVGCINHAILTIRELEKHNINISGWIANCYDDVEYIDDQISSINSISGIKCLAKIHKGGEYDNDESFHYLATMLMSPDEKV